ncbi:unnamed protein product [Caenorhabditis sp. 36 PRJEB53466]|nr:unnamed protein product [Caenorhabditis sp. 36 PRJEB53466]
MCDISTVEQLLEIAKHAAESGETLKFEYKKHIGFLIRHLNVFPQPYNSLETARNTIFLFAISSLDLLGELDNLLTPERRQSYIDWIYGLQFTDGRDFGARWYGQRGFGGLLEDLSGPDDGTAHWIPQYNLEAFWRRQLPPIPVGLVEPLIPPRTRGPENLNRLPGHFTFLTKEFELYNRNLLTARLLDETRDNGEIGQILKIWTVNERSKRQWLECFKVQLNEKGLPIADSVQLIHEKKLKMVPPAKSEHSQRRNEPLLEVRTSIWASARLFLRSSTLLHFLDDFGAQTPIFHVAVKSFAESHLLEGQMTVVDYSGRVWMHDIGGGNPEKADKLETNSEEVWQIVTFTDHPKVVALAGITHVDLVDTRSRSTRELWRSPEFEVRGLKEPQYLQATAPAPAIVRHVARCPRTANNFLVMSDRKCHLVDDRFPGRSVLEVRHPFSSGAHRFVVGETPESDEIGDGEVYSMYCLDQLSVLDSSLSVAKLYHHAGGLWSSAHAFRSLGEPHDFNRTVRRGKHTKGERIVAEPTRAFHLVENPARKSTLLLRQTDDGAVWWQALVSGTMKDRKRIGWERRSAERIAEGRRKDAEQWKREEWRPVYADEMGEEVKETPAQRRIRLHVDVPEVDRRMIAKCTHRAVEAQRKGAAQFHVDTREIAEKLVVLALDDENSVLSKIALDTWAAAEKKATEANLPPV